MRLSWRRRYFLREKNREANVPQKQVSTRRHVESRIFVISLAVLAAAILAGCGGSASKSFTLEVAPSTISITPGGAPQPLIVSAVPANGFSSPVQVTLSSLPSGVTATPSTLT